MDEVQRGASKNALDLVHRTCVAVVLKNVSLGQICGGHLNLDGYHDKPKQEEVFHKKLLSQTYKDKRRSWWLKALGPVFVKL